jgi:hypothetical protein
VTVPSDTPNLRSPYRPKKVRVLFVGEAPPAGGTFFYASNSQVYRGLKEVLQSHLGNPPNFLKAFKDRGYFLDDLALEPINSISGKKGSPVFRADVSLLARRMTEYQPEVVVTLQKRIGPFVQDAIVRAGLDVRHYIVSFPGNGQQANFRREMADIVPRLP